MTGTTPSLFRRNCAWPKTLINICPQASGAIPYDDGWSSAPHPKPGGSPNGCHGCARRGGRAHGQTRSRDRRRGAVGGRTRLDRPLAEDVPSRAALGGGAIGAGAEHVIATELRAAFERVNTIWRHVPPKFRLDEREEGAGAEEERNGMLATYDPPVPQSLVLPARARRLGQRREQHDLCTARRATGPPRARGRARSTLAQVLGIEADVEARVVAALRGVREGQS